MHGIEPHFIKKKYINQNQPKLSTWWSSMMITRPVKWNIKSASDWIISASIVKHYLPGAGVYCVQNCKFSQSVMIMVRENRSMM